MKKFSFPPIVDRYCKVIILGSMPGEVSLQTNQYYNNPKNQFWKIIAYVINENFNLSYEEKKELLLKHHLAIWDVLMHCEREGSLDINISDEVPNDFKSFFSKYDNIKEIFFNGSKAEQMFNKYNLYDNSKAYATLPSTSSANTSTTLK